MNRSALWLILALFIALCSCGKSASPLDKIAAMAGTPAGTRASFEQIIAKGIKAKSFSAGDAIAVAYKRLEAAAAGSTGASADQAASQAATTLAGGVLDAIASLKDSLSQNAEYELFWMNVGRLACRASEEAFANQRLAEAKTLALGGGNRWQNDAYWLRYPDHDGLVSAILAASGDRSGAISRLQSRPNLTGVAQEVYEKLTGR